jgi:hypothetical protein
MSPGTVGWIVEGVVALACIAGMVVIILGLAGALPWQNRREGR